MSSTVGAGVETVSFGSNGTPLVAKGNPSISVSGGKIIGNREGILRLPGGANLPVKASAPLVGSAVAKTIMGAVKAVPVLGTAIYLMELFAEMKYRVSKKPDGSLLVEELKETGGTIYRTRTWDSVQPQERTASVYPAVSCKIAMAEENERAASLGYSNDFVSAGGGLCIFKATLPGTQNPFYTSWSMDSYEIPKHETAYPTTESELEYAIKKRQDNGTWSDTSPGPQAINEAQKITGAPIETEGPKVTGPASVTGPAEVTKTPTPTGTKETTKQTRYDCAYIDGPTVMDGGTVVCAEKVTTTEKTTATNPTTGETTISTVTTAETTKPADTTAQKPTETEDPCLKNPDRVGCATLDTPEGEIPKASRTVEFTAADLGFGGGSCPANVTQTLNGQQVTIVNWVQSCDYITQYVKPLILTLATFAAMVIIFLGGKTE